MRLHPRLALLTVTLLGLAGSDARGDAIVKGTYAIQPASATNATVLTLTSGGVTEPIPPMSGFTLGDLMLTLGGESTAPCAPGDICLDVTFPLTVALARGSESAVLELVNPGTLVAFGPDHNSGQISVHITGAQPGYSLAPDVETALSTVLSRGGDLIIEFTGIHIELNPTIGGVFQADWPVPSPTSPIILSFSLVPAANGIPEPSTLALAAVGLAGAGAAGWVRRRARLLTRNGR